MLQWAHQRVLFILAPRLRRSAHSGSESDSEQNAEPLPLLTPIKSGPVDVGALERVLHKLKRANAPSTDVGALERALRKLKRANAPSTAQVSDASPELCCVVPQGAGVSTDQGAGAEPVAAAGKGPGTSVPAARVAPAQPSGSGTGATVALPFRSSSRSCFDMRQPHRDVRLAGAGGGRRWARVYDIVPPPTPHAKQLHDRMR